MYVIKEFPKDLKREVVSRIIMRPDFEEEIAKARKELGINIKELRSNDSNDTYHRFLEMKKRPKVRAAAERILKRLGIKKSRFDLVVHYLAVDDWIGVRDADNIALIGSKDGKRSVYIRVNKDTSLREIASNWKEITKEIKKINGKPSKRKVWKTMDRDHLIYLLASNGVPIPEIYRDVLQLCGEDLDYGNIKRIESNFRKKLNVPKRFKKYKLKTK